MTTRAQYETPEGRQVVESGRAFQGWLSRGYVPYDDDKTRQHRLVSREVYDLQREAKTVGVDLRLPPFVSEGRASLLWESIADARNLQEARQTAHNQQLINESLAELELYGDERLTDEDLGRLLGDESDEFLDEGLVADVPGAEATWMEPRMIPYIIEADEATGRIIYFQPKRSDPAKGFLEPTDEDRDQVSAITAGEVGAPSAHANMEYNTYTLTAVRPKFEALEGEEPEEGAIPTAFTMPLPTFQYWMPFSKRVHWNDVGGNRQYTAVREHVRGRSLTRGWQEGIQEWLRNHAPNYVVGWFVALMPVGVEGQQWLSMRAGESNCVLAELQRKVESCRRRQTRPPPGEKGHDSGTPTKDECLNMLAAYGYNLKVREAAGADGGVLDGDLEELAHRLQMTIVVRDYEGVVLWPPEMTAEQTPVGPNEYWPEEEEWLDGGDSYPTGRPHLMKIELVRGNGHATAVKMRMPRDLKDEDFRTYSDPPPAPYGETPAQAGQRLWNHLADTIATLGLTRAIIIGTEIIDPDRRLVYRPISLDVALYDLEYGTGLEDWDYKYEHNGMPRAAPKQIGGVQAWHCAKMRKDAGFRSLSYEPDAKVIRGLWGKAQFEAVTYQGAESLPDDIEVDMTKAYLACGLGNAPVPGQAPVPAFKAMLRFGFPYGECQLLTRAAVVLDADTGLERLATLLDVADLAGLVVFSELTLSDACPAAYAHLLTAHVSKHGECVLVIPQAIHALERGLIASYALSAVCYSPEKLPGIRFPTKSNGDLDRDLGVRFVGSCKQVARRMYWSKCGGEAHSYAIKHGAMLTPAGTGANRGNFMEFDRVAAGADYSYVRAYVLAYMAIGMCEALLVLPPDAVVSVKVDAIVLRHGTEIPHDERMPFWSGPEDGWCGPGVFRIKEMHASRSSMTDTPQRSWTFEAGCVPSMALPMDALRTHRLTYLSGQGGCGKTFRALRVYPKLSRWDVAVTGVTNIHCDDLNDPRKNPYRYKAETYHFKLHYNADAEWATESLVCLPKVAIIDEIGCMPGSFLLDAVNWLMSIGAVVILCGDPEGQLSPVDDSAMSVAGALGEIARRHSLHVEDMNVDYRAKDCQALQALKLQMWTKPEETQVGLLHTLPLLTMDQLLDSWSPSDLVVVSTNGIGKEIGAMLATLRAERYPDAPVRVRFQPAKDAKKRYRKKNGVLPLVKRPDGTKVKAMVGCREEVPARCVSDMDRQLWADDTWTTLHLLQGQTVKDRRIIIVEDMFGQNWIRNGCYTAVSRAERLSQLYRLVLRRPAEAENWGGGDDALACNVGDDEYDPSGDAAFDY